MSTREELEPLPRSLDAEKSVLGAILLDPAALCGVVPILEAGDFFDEKNRQLYGAMLDLSRRKAAIDLVTLMEEFPRNGGPEKAGGAAYISALMSGVPDIGNVAHYARIVKEKSVLRRLIRAGETITRGALTQEKDLGALLASASAEIRALEQAAAPASAEALSRLQTLDNVLASMPPPGDRLPTGIGALDKCSRGGFAPGRVYAFVGPPGKGKTALLAQCLRSFAARGAECLGFFHDEGSWQAGMMIAEGVGLDRGKLEDDYTAVQPELQKRAATLRILFAPSGSTLADAEIWLGKADQEKAPAVIGIDSVQKVRVSRGAEPETRKDRADAVMAMTRRLAARGAIVLVTSKANRASWSRKNPKDNTDPLASGLDSSSIEYEADALFFMAGDPSERSFLQICKNRPGDGTEPTIALRYDRDRATFTEIDRVAAAEAEDEADRERRDAQWTADEARVVRTVREHPGKSRRMLRQLLKINSERLGAVLEELSRKGRLVDRKGWHLAFPDEEGGKS